MAELKEMLEPISKICYYITRIYYYITNPIIIWNWIIGIIYYLASTIFIVCTLIYTISKLRKAAQIGILSIFIYVLLKSIDMAFR